MKSNLKFDVKNLTAEVSISNMMENDDENQLHESYMSECMLNEAMFINTAGMSSADAKYMCGMSYMKNRTMLMEGAGELTEKQKGLPNKLKIGILKRYEKAGTLSEEGKKQLQSMASYENEDEREEEDDEDEMNEEKEEMPKQEIKAEPTAVFVEKPAPPSGDITPNAAEEGLKIDEKLKKENVEDALKKPDLQSPTFTPTNE